MAEIDTLEDARVIERWQAAYFKAIDKDIVDKDVKVDKGLATSNENKSIELKKANLDASLDINKTLRFEKRSRFDKSNTEKKPSIDSLSLNSSSDNEDISFKDDISIKPKIDPTKSDPYLDLISSKENTKGILPNELSISKKVSSSNELSTNSIGKKPIEMNKAFEIALALQRNEKILHCIYEKVLQNIEYQNQAILKFSEEDAKLVTEQIKKLKLKENADVVKTMLNLTLASTSIVLGSLLIAPNPIAGVSLMSSGAATILINQLIPRLGGYDKLASLFTSDPEKRQQIADNTEVYATIANTILQLSVCFSTSSLISSFFSSSSVWKIFKTGLDLANTMSTAIYHHAESGFKDIQSKQTLTSGDLKLGRLKLDKYFTDLQTATDFEDNFNKLTLNVFESLQRIVENTTK